MTLKNSVNILDTVFLQEVDDEVILLDVNTEEYFSLNEVGGVFYNILKDEKSLEKVLELLKKQFDMSEVQLQKDLFSFLKALEEKGLLSII